MEIENPNSHISNMHHDFKVALMQGRELLNTVESLSILYAEQLVNNNDLHARVTELEAENARLRHELDKLKGLRFTEQSKKQPRFVCERDGYESYSVFDTATGELVCNFDYPMQGYQHADNLNAGFGHVLAHEADIARLNGYVANVGDPDDSNG